jgi:hypothetical protein
VISRCRRPIRRQEAEVFEERDERPIAGSSETDILQKCSVVNLAGATPSTIFVRIESKFFVVVRYRDVSTDHTFTL